MAEMKEKNEYADFLWLYTTCQWENECQKQREKDLKYQKKEVVHGNPKQLYM